MRATSIFVVLLATAGCSTAPAVREPVATVDAEVTAGAEVEASSDQAAASPQAEPTPAPGTIPRAQLARTLDAGLGRFLGSVRVDPVLQRGAFVGFRIVAFRDPDGLYRGVDLMPGDVVVRVNGSPIERPEQALAIWNGLRVTSELCVEYVRGSERREIRYPIVD